MALSRFDNFTMAGIAGLDGEGHRQAVYVHDKLMLVDDEWGTVGSCNLHRYSFFGNSELNVAFRDPVAVRDMRVALFAEHLAHDTSSLDDRAALRVFRAIARENRRRADRGEPGWQGLAFALDAAAYGEPNARELTLGATRGDAFSSPGRVSNPRPTDLKGGRSLEFQHH